MKFYSFLFVFVFPTFIKALTCQNNGRCEINKTDIGLLNFDKEYHHKPCEDACVYFKCVTPFGTIMEGAGCYTTFERACRYIKTDTKTKIIENLRNSTFEYFDEALMFVSCRDKDNCAKDAFEKMKSINPEADRNFGIYFHDRRLYKQEIHRCFYDNLQLHPPPHKILCTSRRICDTGKNYDVEYAGGDVEDYNAKFCDACIYFRRAVLNGTRIYSITGCIEDLKHELSEYFYNKDIPKNIKNYFYFDDNYVIVSCNTWTNCHKNTYKFYLGVYPKAILKVNDTADGEC